MEELFHIEDGTLFLQQENEVLSVTAWGKTPSGSVPSVWDSPPKVLTGH